MFALQSDITIGDFRFSGVHEVRIERSLHTWEDRAYIRIPARARIAEGGRASATMRSTAELMTDGDAVEIKLGYDGRLKTEFKGFVKRRNAGMPLEIECEGYGRLLRQKSLNVNLTKGIAIKQLLALITAGTGIKVVCPVDFTMYGRVLTNTDGIKVLQEVKKVSDGALTVFFIAPDTLWCGLMYTQYLAGTEVFSLPRASYDLGYNCIKDNALRERVPDEQVQVIINGRLASGDTVRTASDEKKDARKVQYLENGVKDSAVLRTFAQEKADQHNYRGYEGYLTGFLEPYCLPGYTVLVQDDKLKERTGLYVCESVQVTFGMNGARRRVELGPKVGGGK